jgi:hypothetical protein
VMMSPLRFAAMVSPSAIANARGKRTATLLPDLKVLVWTGLFMALYIRDIQKRGKPVLSGSGRKRAKDDDNADEGEAIGDQRSIWECEHPAGGVYCGAKDGGGVASLCAVVLLKVQGFLRRCFY